MLGPGFKIVLRKWSKKRKEKFGERRVMKERKEKMDTRINKDSSSRKSVG